MYFPYFYNVKLHLLEVNFRIYYIYRNIICYKKTTKKQFRFRKTENLVYFDSELGVKITMREEPERRFLFSFL